ncbi:hypothetical protein MB901379_03227 [Mycobacterium basiliense]|uniref:Uncharacterized protein n=1 Tax=Mycobacterium basiliense TaxID=2094119 RepID=A0A447GGV4_9MYCO|nr:hypothetical protein MB901379_03227 [Mycobacterium basiliense]
MYVMVRVVRETTERNDYLPVRRHQESTATTTVHADAARKDNAQVYGLLHGSTIGHLARCALLGSVPDVTVARPARSSTPGVAWRGARRGRCSRRLATACNQAREQVSDTVLDPPALHRR